MTQRVIAGLIAVALLCMPTTAVATGTSSTSGGGESSNPINDQGSNYNYRSTITSIQPAIPGLKLEVLEFADRLVLRNHTGKVVTVYGYQGEPYARVLANGTVQVNTTSPAYFLNQNFYGDVNVPASATPTATPDWSVVDRTGELEWHDHRIHWMSPAIPPEVKDKSKRTKVFNWQVPISVGTEHAVVNGELFWVPEEGTKTPTAAIVVLVVVVIAGLAFVLAVRRRRRGGAAFALGAGASAPDRDAEGDREAW